MASVKEGVRRLLAAYPRIYFACHQRHRRDPKTGDALSASQASVLDHLDDREATTVGGLAEHMGVTASTMSLNLDRLEARGYVRRERDARDRRRVGVVLTEAGVRMRLAASVLEEGLIERLLEGMSETDREAGLRGLELLAKAAEEMRSGD